MRDPGQDPAAAAASVDASGDGRLSAPELVRAATRAIGLDDLGDPAAVDALGVLVDAIESDGELSPSGRRRVRSMLTGLLEQRLRTVDFAATSDVVDYETVPAPIIVTGLPGTGTTLLADLLAQDPHNRALLGWEAATVAPPPRLADLGSDPRLRDALVDDEQSVSVPDLAAERPAAATLPTECVQLLGASFASVSFETMIDVSSYGDWLTGADMTGAYRFHQLALRTLQTTVPTERWSLASPAHLWHLDALRAVYPDALLIVTHRDPARVVPGIASLCTSRRSLVSDIVDPGAVGRHWWARCHQALDASAPHLADWDADAVLHLPHAELVDDPVGSIERAYQRFGLELSDLGRRRMAAWLDQRPRGRVEHRDAARFGLDEAGLRRDFASYMTERDIPTEP